MSASRVMTSATGKVMSFAKRNVPLALGARGTAEHTVKGNGYAEGGVDREDKIGNLRGVVGYDGDEGRYLKDAVAYLENCVLKIAQH